MRFTFGPSNIISFWLYCLGIPVVLLMFFDLTFGWQIVTKALNLQLFLLGAIVVALASIINITIAIKRSIEKTPRE